MSQGRLIHQSIWSSYEIKKCSFRQRILWIGIILESDDYGFLKGDCGLLRSKIFPYDDLRNADVTEDLKEFVSLGLIESFEIDKDHYVRIKNFERYQNLHSVKKLPSKIAPLYNKHVLKLADSNKDSVKEIDNESYNKFEVEIVDYWNDFVKVHPVLSSVIRVSVERRTHLKNRFLDKHFKESYKEVIDKISKSRFLLGNNERSWKVFFDWLIQNETNYLKVLEGRYEDKGKTGNTGNAGIDKYLIPDSK